MQYYIDLLLAIRFGDTCDSVMSKAKIKVTHDHPKVKIRTGANPGFPSVGLQPINWPNFPENCMKIRKIGPGGGACVQNFTTEICH